MVDEISFNLGIPGNELVENISIDKAVLIAFRRVKQYIKTPVDKTVAFSHRIDLPAVGIHAKKILSVQPSRPRVGLTNGSFDGANVFQLAAALSTQVAVGTANAMNMDPIMTELATVQLRNTLTTDMHWKHDVDNDVLYCTYKEPLPTTITITYTPDYQDVSEIKQVSWTTYIVRMATALMKQALGRSRSKYRVEGSNVSLDGETLLSEGNAEMEQLLEELESRRTKITVVT